VNDEEGQIAHHSDNRKGVVVKFVLAVGLELRQMDGAANAFSPGK
jgi:hypothetical protein